MNTVAPDTASHAPEHSPGDAELLSPEIPWPQEPDLDVAGLHAAAAGQAAGQAAKPIPRVKDQRKRLVGNRLVRRCVLGGASLGICVLAYLNFWPKSTVPDLLGTSLPSVPAEVIASALPQVEPVDPRLSDASADMLGDFSGFVPAPEPASAGTDLVSSLDGQPVLHTPVAGAESAASAMTVAAAVPAPESTPPTEAPRPPAGPDNTELLQRLQRMELLLAQLQKQLEQQAAATSLSAPAAGVVGPVPAARPKPAPVQKVAKATTPKALAAPKASQPVKATPVQVAKQPTAPAPKLSGQLVSVDMWNGQPSVVVASGIAGDRRVRVLRPGDVINGLALRSADPVTQSATFAVPGSAGLTLYVSQGG
ncbi:Uncharacterised protein [Comamonas aquatica]|uniref:hypothetical protein n=1 Tax=Comamonas aquatica TaxID=225991 RepID=UPI001EF193E2|nr:hypothetical protein [Comamonas aquatica]CAB5695365.1 Uncharacterised protein [Comamonas aquatica]CAC9218078.1 Uncharacterised protein [Comamonas aquatica]